MQDSFIQYQFAAQQLRNGFARQVIFGGPEAAARQNQRNALERVAKRLRQQFAIVAHNRLADDFDSQLVQLDRKSTRLNSSHTVISYAVFCLKKKKTKISINHIN